MDSNSPSPAKPALIKNRPDLINQDIKYAISRSSIFGGQLN